jgi:thiamine kinase-like enzyme
MSFGTPVKLIIDYKINDLETDYLKKLHKAIPILEDKELLQLILNYCEEMQNTEQLKSSDVKKILRNINRKLKELKKIELNIELNTSNKRNTEKKNNTNITKFLKYDKIDCTSLIEAIIAFTFNYYRPDISPAIRLNKSNNSRFIHRMNKIEGITLCDYIILHLSDIDFKTNFLTILHKIASQLSLLQDNFLFIHGDLHLRNIMIIGNMNIIFIDFGHSTIKLPTQNGMKNIILSASVESNIERRLSLNLMEHEILKGIDLTHLFRELLYLSETNQTNQILLQISKNLNELCYFIPKFNIHGLHKIRIKNDLDNSITNNLDKSIIFPKNLLKLKLNVSTGDYEYGDYNSSRKRLLNKQNSIVVKRLSFFSGNN